uniref:Expansin-like CBD domain-containing protein n=1 Tax=Fagus sylvatica TaxID=28930 RepID=A0A2N9GP43_FAGSY
MTLSPSQGQPITVALIAMGLQVELVGFGEFGRTVNDGYVSGVARLYRNGTGCGGCYQEDCQQWTAMRKAYGAVWDMASPPSGSIKLRFQVSGSAGITWVQPRRALPSDWKVGVAYDSDIQLT